MALSYFGTDHHGSAFHGSLFYRPSGSTPEPEPEPEPEPQPEPQPGHTPGGGGSGGAGGGFLHRRTLRRRHAPDIDVELLVDDTLDEQDVLDLFHLLLQSGMIE